jgi:hypothetical protein
MGNGNATLKLGLATNYEYFDVSQFSSSLKSLSLSHGGLLR